MFDFALPPTEPTKQIVRSLAGTLPRCYQRVARNGTAIKAFENVLERHPGRAEAAAILGPAF